MSTVEDDRWPTDTDLLAALRAGDTDAFTALVDALHAPLVRLARVYVTPALAEDAVQDTWVNVIRGLHRFEGRSSLKTWIYRIMLNRVRTLATREGRLIPFATAGPEVDTRPSVDPDHLDHPEHGAHYWPDAPPRWDLLPEQHLMSREVHDVVAKALATLPASQREVVVMRDIEGWTSAETCASLGISGANQRVLLHRGRAAIRTALEVYLS
ncbi:RNA polymerase sigma factor [Lolliginicoccus levis]|uniref:RNA polymerase sigma factor n=1 Tax=Lolliginicoccus levis TaxID=2919542 RepID=UPI00241D99C7|nr:RNA polymerase sigma factor [Lolliginicoccus levis]